MRDVLASEGWEEYSHEQYKTTDDTYAPRCASPEQQGDAFDVNHDIAETGLCGLDGIVEAPVGGGWNGSG